MVLIMAACQQTTKQNEAKVEEEATAFVYPEIPVMLQTVEDRMNYLVEHYWDHFDFTDTTLIHKPEVLEQALSNYLDLLSRLPQEVTCQQLIKTMLLAAADETMQDYVVRMIDSYWSNPNSPIHNEAMYEVFAEALQQAATTDDTALSKALYKVKLMRTNRVGTVATDFTYTLADGNQKRLHDLKASGVLLVCYDPDCKRCNETIRQLKASEVIGKAVQQGGLKVLAFYPEEDYDLWEQYRREIPDAWINAYDKELAVMHANSYDLRAMPTIYLLDADKRVLLRDAEVGEIEDFLEH